MMYYDELSQAKQYVEQIQEIIKKLSGKPSKETVKVEKLPKPAKKKKAGKVLAKPAENKPTKKAGRKPKVVAPSAKSVPVAANTANTKATIKTVEPKPKKVAAKTKAAKKKPTAKPSAKKTTETKAIATVESVVGSLLTTAPKKAVLKKVSAKKKKPTQKQRIQEMAASANLIKPEVK